MAAPSGQPPCASQSVATPVVCREHGLLRSQGTLEQQAAPRTGSRGCASGPGDGSASGSQTSPMPAPAKQNPSCLPAAPAAETPSRAPSPVLPAAAPPLSPPPLVRPGLTPVRLNRWPQPDPGLSLAQLELEGLEEVPATPCAAGVYQFGTPLTGHHAAAAAPGYPHATTPSAHASPLATPRCR